MYIMATNSPPIERRGNNKMSDIKFLINNRVNVPLKNKPQLNKWNFPDESWGEPVYYGDDIEFRNGIIDIMEAGTYRIGIQLNFKIINDEFIDLTPTVRLRMIRGNITNKHIYKIIDVANCVGKTVLVKSRSSSVVTISCEAIVSISNGEIHEGENSIMPQYMIGFRDSDMSNIQNINRIDVDRNTDELIASLNVAKII